MIAAWRAFGGRLNPGLLRRFDGDYAKWLKQLKDFELGIGIGDSVPQTLYLLKSENVVLGATAIRSYLNHTNDVSGGHIAYGIHPSYRGRGFGKLALRLTLGVAADMGIFRALITCDTDNLASQGVILSCGGILENHAFDEKGVPINRYWVNTL